MLCAYVHILDERGFDPKATGPKTKSQLWRTKKKGREATCASLKDFKNQWDDNTD